MDTSMMNIWYEKVWKPYIAGCEGESGLLLDDYICHKDADLFEKMKADKAHRWLILSHYSSTVQPCDVGIN